MKEYTFLTLFLFFFIFSCKKEEKKIGEYRLTEEQRKTIPFTGNEKLVYEFEGKLIELQGQGREKQTKKVYADNYQIDYYIIEKDKVVFEGKKAKLVFYLYYNFSQKEYVYLIRSFNTEVITEGKKFSSYYEFSIPLSKTKYQNNNLYIDTFNSCDTTFHNVFLDTINFLNPVSRSGESDSLFFKTLYFTKKEGVVKLEYQDQTAWCLKSIEP